MLAPQKLYTVNRIRFDPFLQHIAVQEAISAQNEEMIDLLLSFHCIEEMNF